MFFDALQDKFPQQVQMHMHFIAGIVHISFKDCPGNAAMIKDCIVFPLEIQRNGNIAGYGRIQDAV